MSRREYDADGNEVAISWDSGNDGAEWFFTSTFDAAGNRLTIQGAGVDAPPSYRTTFDYSCCISNP